jgi:AraC-like DNA-binding protein
LAVIVLESPFIFIETKMSRREEFEITAGRQPTFALLYLKEGSFSLEIGGEKAILRAGDCAVFSDDIDFFRSVLQPISFIHVKFRINPKCPFSLPVPSGKVLPRDPARFRSSIESYERLLDADNIRAVHYKEHLLTDILWQIFAESHRAMLLEQEADSAEFRLHSCRDETVRTAVAFIRNNIRQKLPVDTICQAVGTNPSTLNFRFRRELSCSVGAFITGERISLARRLLRSTTYSIGAIAQQCGYDNIYYFSTAFGNATGCSPSAYRAQHR